MAARQGPEGWQRPLWRLSPLGGLELSRDDAIQPLPSSVQRLVAFVSLNGPVGRASLAGTLWPEASEEHAHGSLRSALWRLGKSQPGMLQLGGSSVALHAGVSVDVRDLCDTAELLLAGAAPSAGAPVPASCSMASCCPAGTTTGCCSSASACASCACTRWRRWR